ncbi:MAG TPA: hypothetical protein VMD47_06835 [Candidatus Acidoferrales bacterium]|nr:hypothetical protein [Candidatus Acidoferrales bacterium]
MRLRLVVAFAAAGAFIALAGLAGLPALAVARGPSCGEKLFTNELGIQIRVLWAKNGAVQRFEVVDSKENPEETNDMKVDLERVYGDEGAGAPPLQIVSFKPGGSGGMMVPDKAVDSCGRTISF